MFSFQHNTHPSPQYLALAKHPTRAPACNSKKQRKDDIQQLSRKNIFELRPFNKQNLKRFHDFDHQNYLQTRHSHE